VCLRHSQNGERVYLFRNNKSIKHRHSNNSPCEHTLCRVSSAMTKHGTLSQASPTAAFSLVCMHLSLAWRRRQCFLLFSFCVLLLLLLLISSACVFMTRIRCCRVEMKNKARLHHWVGMNRCGENNLNPSAFSCGTHMHTRHIALF
jgi:hypothetical protein